MTIKSFASGMFGKLKKYFPKKNVWDQIEDPLGKKIWKEIFFVDIPH